MRIGPFALAASLSVAACVPLPEPPRFGAPPPLATAKPPKPAATAPWGESAKPEQGRSLAAGPPQRQAPAPVRPRQEAIAAASAPALHPVAAPSPPARSASARYRPRREGVIGCMDRSYVRAVQSIPPQGSPAIGLWNLQMDEGRCFPAVTTTEWSLVGVSGDTALMQLDTPANPGAPRNRMFFMIHDMQDGEGRSPGDPTAPG